jgi:hypothetical protein
MPLYNGYGLIGIEHPFLIFFLGSDQGDGRHGPGMPGREGIGMREVR